METKTLVALPKRTALVLGQSEVPIDLNTSFYNSFATENNTTSIQTPTMSKTFTKFAVAGAGGVGASVVDELLKKNLEVTVLTRDDTKEEMVAFKSRGAVVAKLDYTDREAVKNALTGVEAVVSSVGPFAVPIQADIAHAAKAAGVELFVPAEFGIDVSDGMHLHKKAIQDLLKEIELPYTLFFNGLFYEYVSLALGFDFSQESVPVVGDGKTKFSLTKRSEIGQVVAHVLTTAPKSELEWAKIPFEGDRKSSLDVIAIAEQKLGKKIGVTFVDYEENKKKYDSDFGAFLSTLFADGRGVAGPEGRMNEVKATYFPDWKPTSYETFELGQ